MDTEQRFREFIIGKNILVTGGTGSIGRIIVKNLIECGPKVIRVLSRDTNKQIQLQSEIGPSSPVRFIVGDVRDLERILMACEDIDVIFHAAAFKYVPQGEYNPFEVVQTNVIGTQNLITAALKTPSVHHFVMVSTDKAVQPTNTMGASKLLAERLVSAAHYIRGSKPKVFTTVRFGNVLGTAGSVLPVFLDQIKKGAVVVTHPEMARFFMTTADAVRLVFAATTLAHGGEIFVLKMPMVKISDLAEVCVARFARRPTPITYGPIRPGEKIDELLLTSDEATAALETESMYIIVPRIEVGDIRFHDYTYPGARPITSHTYHTRTAPRLSPAEITELLNRVLADLPATVAI